MSIFGVISPVGLVNFLSGLFHYDGPLGWWIVIAALVELVLILLGVYPKFPRWSSRKRVNAFYFYALLNVVTNLALFFWLARDLGV